MTVWLVTRHPGAREWVARKGLVADREVSHLDVTVIRPADIVVGTLPVHLAAAIQARGARFFSLSIEVPMQYRGRELSADDLERHGARIEEYRIEPRPGGPIPE